MASYLVMQHPDNSSGSDEKVKAEAILVRDGFHVFGFLVPFLWLLFHRLWIEALFVLAATIALSGLGSLAGLGPAAPVLSLLVSLYVGLEGSALKLAALRRRGWRDVGVVEADNASDAETRYFFDADENKDEQPAQPAAPIAASAPIILPRQPSGPALGLFSYPGQN